MVPLSLQSRIQKTLESSRNRVLIQDSGTSFTGLQIKEFIISLQIRLNEISQEGSRIALFFPNLAVQGLALLAVIASRRVPVIFSHEEHLQSGSKLSEQLLQFDCQALLSHMGTVVHSGLPQLNIDAGARISLVHRGQEGWSRPAAPADAAMVLFTSGSTGAPKAVELSQSSILYTIDFLVQYLKLDAHSVAGITLPISHTMALNTQFLPTFFAMGRSVFMNSDLDKTRAFALFESSEANFLAVIGDILFLYEKEMNLRKLKPVETVQHVQMAGGIIQEKHLRLAQKLFPKAKIYKGYGLTEVIRTAMIDSDHPAFFTEAVGKMLPGQIVQIRDENLKVLPANQSGQVFIKGPSLMLGYQNEAQPLTQDGFLPTGDLGSIDEQGLLYIQGRNDEVFKTLGKKVSAIEIEKTVLDLELVQSAKCIRVPCDRKGYKPVLFVQTESQFRPTNENEVSLAVRKHLTKYLETYKVPTDVVVVDKMPKLANQKINRKAVYELWELGQQKVQTFSQ